MLKAIRKAQRKGSLVAGSSAGAAIMSEVMFSGGTSLEAATYGVVGDADQPGILPGLGFFPWRRRPALHQARPVRPDGRRHA